MEIVQIILNTESTLCLLFVICFYAPFFATCLYVFMFWSYISLKFLTYNSLMYLLLLLFIFLST